MTSYYNEIDPAAVAVLRAFIDAGLIAPGIVDSRSIKEVTANDVKGFTQVHWFAGGGLWSYAARLARWGDDRHIWSASCPCQPLSVAGKRLAAADPRHLWPDLFRIISAANAAGHGPSVIVGEQVSGAAGYGWFDGVRADLAQEGIASRTRDIPACAIDAPIERNRLWWLALAGTDDVGRRGGLETPGQRQPQLNAGNGDVASTESLERGGDVAERGPEGRAADRCADASGTVVEPESERRGQGRTETAVQRGRPAATGTDVREHGAAPMGGTERAGLEGLGGNVDRGRADGRRPDRNSGIGEAPATARPTTAPNGRNGSWYADAAWIICHDKKARRAKPGIPMLVDGMVGRASLWRLAGNSINPILASEVIGALMDVLDNA